MKYIKLYEEIDQSFIYQVSQFINWKMISDIKDMSLEYIDEGYTLNITVFSIMHNNGISPKIMKLVFNHTQSDIIWGIPRVVEKEDISYRVKLVYKHGKFDSNKKISEILKTSELLKRINDSYPNEKVRRHKPFRV